MKRNVLLYVVLAIIGIGLPLFVLFRNIFPHFEYSLHQSGEFGLGLASKDLAGNKYLVAALGTSYPFDTTELELEIDSATAQTTPQIRLELAKDYMANTYPIGQVISDEASLRRYLFEGNPAGIANGSLYSYAESVFVVSRGQYYPIIAPVVFESLGYHWEQVLPIPAEAYAELEATEKINYMSPHPDGTLLKTKQAEFFVVWEGKRLPIADARLIENVWKTYYWVDVTDKEVDYFAQCQAKVKGSGKASCLMQYDPAKLNSLGNVYVIKSDPAVLGTLQSGQSVFETTLTTDKQYLKFSLGQIKNKLYMRYAGYFL